MALMIELLVGLSLLELLLIGRYSWSIRRPLAVGLSVVLALVSGGILGTRLSLATGIVAIISLYRVVNLLRLLKDRRDEVYLRRSVQRVSLSLFTAQVCLLSALAIADLTKPVPDTWWGILSLVQLAFASSIYLTTKRQLRTTAPLAVSQHFSDNQLPSLTVCVPARNETAALETCLRSLIASDYPKLEIIVLDDCSQGNRTSDIIRSFAHDGVRFIQGAEAPEGWLAKNWAYQQLFEASSGELLLFCGVDIQFEKSAIRNTVTALLAKQKRLLSIIPHNQLASGRTGIVCSLIQPARYAWELCLPRRHFSRPPVLSSCWLAQRQLIERSGSFRAVRNTILPETYFARRATRLDGYSFSQAIQSEIVSTKGRDEQWATAVRTRYPQLHRRLDLVFYVTLIELSLIVAPPIMLIIGLAQGLWLQAYAAGLATVLLAICYYQVVLVTYRRSVQHSFLLVLPAAVLDSYLRHESAWRYEFGEVIWKERNVCLPVMRVIPRLPRL